ncbi:MAG TPA: 30S ribosomal protein S6 [Bacteroidetes bacterium]|nr:30S ribosomal protein S6 [Bacteroidota bacterium]
MVQHYELLYIVTSSADDKKLEEVNQKVSDFITKSGGSITKKDDWGKRKLAYEINHEKYGNYVLMEFDADQEMLEKLDASMQLMSEVLRQIVVSKRVKSESEVAKEKQLKEKIEAKRAEKKRVAEAAAQAEATTEDLGEKPAETKKETKEAKGEKISLEDLDKKLDEILKEEI